jgi:prephenate dehydratase
MHPQITRVAADDTAGSVRQIVAARDASHAAIASRRAAALHGGAVLLEGLEDDPQNFTRFLLLAPRTHQPAAANKLTVLLHLAHRPGTLHRALEVVARARMNLLKIESRPLVGTPWHYRFFLDIQTPPDRAAVDLALDALRKEAEEMRILGWYRAAGTPVAETASDSRSAVKTGASR